MKYIDVSEWQGVIDWETVKDHIDGAILRAGYGQNHFDQQFARNAAECNRLGIPCGAYWFSYAHSPAMAQKEAEYLLAAVQPYRMELPLCFDFEYDSVAAAEKNGVMVTKSLATSLVYAFCETIEKGGYWALNYANPDYLNRYFDANIPRRFGLWLAVWPSTVNLDIPPRSDCPLWQWTSKGSVPGISGNVDIDEAYTDFAAVIREKGMNHLPKTYEDGDSVIIEYAPPSPATPAETALQWARNQGLCGDVTAASPVTWGELATVIFKIHGPEDRDEQTRLSGLISD